VPALIPRPQRHDTGTRLPALRTAAGLVIAGVYPDRLSRELRLAVADVTDPVLVNALAQARTHGFARITDGIYPGLTTVSVPLTVKRDEPWAITVAGVTELMPPAGAEGPLVQRMRKAAEALSAA
jgi:DNA-binding IclR family transcriptional regulator